MTQQTKNYVIRWKEIRWVQKEATVRASSPKEAEREFTDGHYRDERIIDTPYSNTMRCSLDRPPQEIE